MKKNSQLEMPVALVFFNRPWTLEKVFRQICQVRPRKLFLICDGARLGNNEDVQRIKVCQLIVGKIDWPCEVYKNYSKENLGCGVRVSSGLDWVFTKVDQAIILEDDCVPNEGFFFFCEEMLRKYKFDERIMLVSGMNHLGRYPAGGPSYFFSKGVSIWGWATWKRAWSKFNFEREILNDPKTKELLKGEIAIDYIYRNKMRYQHDLAREIKSGKPPSSWCRYWHVAVMLNSGLGIVPNVNMITNIGGGLDSTHFVKMSKNTKKLLGRKRYKMRFPLIPPRVVVCDRAYDKEFYKLVDPKVPELRLFLSKIKYSIFK